MPTKRFGNAAGMEHFSQMDRIEERLSRLEENNYLLRPYRDQSLDIRQVILDASCHKDSLTLLLLQKETR